MPAQDKEAALALGATRWEMIRMAVLPFGKSAVISGSMLGLGRALGETMAVTIILSVSGIVTFNLVSQENPTPIAANIALKFPESSGVDVNALIRFRDRPHGPPIKAVFVLFNQSPYAIIARKSRGIHALADIEGVTLRADGPEGSWLPIACR